MLPWYYYFSLVWFIICLPRTMERPKNTLLLFSFGGVDPALRTKILKLR